jgi:ATP-binding protein involved in chromosome partitioning
MSDASDPQDLRVQVEGALAAVADPWNGADLKSARVLRECRLDGGVLHVSLALGYPARGLAQGLADPVARALAGVGGAARVAVQIGQQIIPHATQQGTQAVPGIKNLVAVASGKGGVGKSTVATNLALALAAEGAQVGVLDADVYGPSQPVLLGIRGKPRMSDGTDQKIVPMENHGIRCMSIGFLVDPEQPMIWRGPMATQALEQLLRDTAWGELDYLVVDMPPGTGDIQLTLAQRVPVSGAVIVTTPQDLAVADAVKGLKMFQKVKVPVLGLVENMATHVCSHCGHEDAIFGSGGGDRMAEMYDLPLLGRLPLDGAIRAQADSGAPTVVADPDGRTARVYRDIALGVAARLALAGKDWQRKFPKISVVQD